MVNVSTVAIKGRAVRRRAQGVILGFLTLPTLFMLLFLGAPVVWAVYVSLTNLGLTGPSARHPAFVGFQNYYTMLTSPVFWHSVGASLAYLVGSGLVGQLVLGLALALLVRRLPRGFKHLLLAFVILSWVIPELVTAFIWSAYLRNPSGLFTTLVGLGGVKGQPWLYQHPMLSLIVANTWRGTAFSMLVLGSAIESIPRDLIEAAQIDGATRPTLFARVMVPQIRGAIATALVLITLWTMSDFTLIYVLTSGGPGYATDVLTVFTYQQSFQFYELGYGSALSVFLVLIASVLSLFYVRVAAKEF
jgi:multiple sugar transport system permease protein